MEKERLVQITRQKSIPEEEFYPMIDTMYEQIWCNLLPPQIPTDRLATKRAFNVVTAPDAPVPDCLTCGACCVALPCVGVRPDEEIREENYWDVTIQGKNGEIAVDRFLRRDAETLSCASLEIRSGTTALCQIYEQRPRMCRDFEAGSDKCHALRRAFGFEPFLSLEEMTQALQKIENKLENRVPGQTIREVKFVENAAGELEVSARLKDGSVKIIDTFDRESETWRQFEFDGLTLAEAEDLIDSRRRRNS